MSYPHFIPPANSTLYVPFATYAGSTGASITLTGLAVTDIEIYKNGSITQRASDAGYALLDTDGIDFDGITGIHGFSIDLSDNTDAGFYVAGGSYFVVVSAVTVDSQTVNFIACSFRIMAAEAGAGSFTSNVAYYGGTAGTFASGRPEVNASHIAGSAVSTTTAQIGVNVVQVSADSTAADNLELAYDGTGYKDVDNLYIIRANTAQAGAAGTITLDASASAVDDFYNNTLIFVYGGTGVGQARIITDYVGATKVATVGENWATNPSSDSTFIIYPGGGAAVAANVTQWLGTAVATPTVAGVPEVDQTHYLGSASPALVGGRFDASVGAMAANVMTAAAAAADLTTELQTGLATAAALDTVDNFIDTEVASILAAVDTEVASILTIVTAVQALLDDARGEPGQGTPAVNPDAMTKLDYLYKAWRNRHTQTSTEYSLYADDGTTKDHEAAVSDDGTTFIRGEIATGA